MYVVKSYDVAVLLSVVTMICWGSWANSKKLLSSTWSFIYYYWDYVLGVLLLATVMALTLGSHGSDGRGFLEDLDQATFDNLAFALTGGVVFNLANILVVAAIELAGMAVVFPLAIGIGVILGVAVNYIALPSGDPWSLGGGVLCVVVAIILDGMAYRHVQHGKSNQSNKKALSIAIIGGLLLGFFYRLVAESMSVDFEILETGKLGPYAAFVVFAIGMVLSTPIWHKLYKAYLKSNSSPDSAFGFFDPRSISLHSVGIGGGVIWGIGMGLSIIASGQAGYAISYGLGEGATMVAALWGILVWKEFRGAPRVASYILALMMSFYMLGLGLIIASKID